jgi:energy-coupling factor transporter ATP-binding protein EcfA2
VEAAKLEMLVSTTRPKQPYPGLRPFEPEEWSIFFGRETMVDDVIERLANQRVVLIHGASGSGKSSLVRAGVLPKLARQHLRHGIAWLTCAMRPSGGPLWNLAREFARFEGRADDLDRIGNIIRLFNRRGATLSSVVDALDGLAGKRLCILVDQFEELFRFERETSREEAELFVELLIGQIARDDSGPQDPDAEPNTEPHDTNIHIAITMRSEFLGECARFNGFAEAINRTQYLVPRIKYDKLVHAIRRPAQLYNGDVTVELAERLIADVRGREDELPLIQHGLMLLWTTARTARPDGPITLDVQQFEYAGGLTKLLSDHADRVMTGAGSSKRFACAIERLFCALTDINAEGRAIRRPQSFHELVAIGGVSAVDLRVIIDAFRQDGVSFLTPYFPTEIEEKTMIDISHEALIRCWAAVAEPQHGWLRREFQDGLAWRSLLIDARAFQINRKHLLSPVATDQRVTWLAERSTVWTERYGGGRELVDQLLEASRRAAIRSKRIKLLAGLPVLYLAFVAAVYATVGERVSGPLELVGEIVSWLVLAGITFLIGQLAIDYSYQIARYKFGRHFLVLITSIAFFSPVVGRLFKVSPIAEKVFDFLFYCVVAVTGVWIVSWIARLALKYFSPYRGRFERWRILEAIYSVTMLLPKV